MKIEVTQEDIDNGVAKQFDQCPVALAVQRATGQDVLVDPYFINVGSIDIIHTPSIVVGFIRDFDSGRPVLPFSFELPCE